MIKKFKKNIQRNAPLCALYLLIFKAVETEDILVAFVFTYLSTLSIIITKVVVN